MAFIRIKNRRGLLVLIVVLFSVLIRLLHLVESGDDPSANQPLVDSRTYHQLAVGLAEEGILDEHFLWQAPLYPLLLAGIYRLFGVSMLVVKLLQILLAGGTCLLTIRLGRKLFNERVGLLAGILVALCGPLLFFDQQLLATGLAVFWMVALANLVLQVRQQDHTPASWSALGLGLVGALAILTRPTFLPIVCLLLGCLLCWRLPARRLALNLVGLVVVLVPFALTMQNLTGHTGLLPPSGAINLFIGNNANFDETIGIRTGLPWENLISEPMRHGFPPGPWHGQPYFRSLVWQFVSERPGEFLGLLVRKTCHLISSRELPRNLDMYVHRQWSTVLSLLVFKAGPWGFPMALLWPLAAIGVMVSGFRKLGPILWMLLAFSVSLVLVFVTSRYRAPLLPLLCVLSAHSLMWSWGQVRQKNWRSLAPAAALFLGMTLLVSLPGPFAQEKVDLQSELHYGVGWNHYRQENWLEAENELRRAVSLDDDFPEAHHFLALVLAHQERWDEAMEHFLDAVRLDPDYTDAVNNLVLCRGKRAESHYRRGRALEGSNPEGAMEIYWGIISIFPDWPEVSVRLAWMLSTCEEKNLRDADRALELLSQPSVTKVLKDPYVMHVKSAALAEAGRFDEAIQMVEMALGKIAEGTRRDLAIQLNQALILYRAGKTLH